MKSIAKKVLSCLLVIAISFSLLPLGAFAEDVSATAWTKVSLEEITPDDTVAVTMTKGDVTYVLPAAGKGALSQPLGDIGVIDGTTLTTAGGSSDYGWSIAAVEGGYTLQTGGGYLYIDISENKNNCVRIGETAAVWALGETGYLSTEDSNGTTRYLGVYTSAPDWRAYDNTTGNTKEQTLGFWVLDPNATPSEIPDSGEPPVTPEPTPTPGPSEDPAPSTGASAALMDNVGDGAVVYVYHPESGTVLTEIPDGNQLESTPGTVEAGQLTVTSDMVQLFVTVDSEGKYSFQNEAGEYLTATSFNQLAFSGDSTANGQWTMEAL